MFEDEVLSPGFYAQDKALSDGESVTCLCRPVYSENAVVLAGANVSGESVTLSLVDTGPGRDSGTRPLPRKT